jgi:hypothetical protein
MAFSAKGAKWKSLGHRPRGLADNSNSAESAKYSYRLKDFVGTSHSHNGDRMSRLQRFCSNLTGPGAMPQVFAFRALGA